MRDAEIGGHLALERLDFRAADETLAVADTADRGQDLVAHRPVLGLQIQERDGHQRRDIISVVDYRLITGAPQSGRSLRTSVAPASLPARVFRMMSISSPA